MPRTYNSDGTCGYVAAAILLAYYEIRFDKRVLPYSLSFKLDDLPSTVEKEHTMIFGLGSSGVGPSYALHQYLYLEIGLKKLGKSYWLSHAGVKDVMNSQLRTHSPLPEKEIRGREPFLGLGSIKSHIDSGRPVIGTFIQYDFYNPTTNKYYESRGAESAHNVVIYGYQETADGLFYHAHMGWAGRGGSNNLIISAGTMGRWGYTYIEENIKNKQL